MTYIWPLESLENPNGPQIPRQGVKGAQRLGQYRLHASLVCKSSWLYCMWQVQIYDWNETLFRWDWSLKQKNKLPHLLHQQIWLPQYHCLCGASFLPGKFRKKNLSIKNHHLWIITVINFSWHTCSCITRILYSVLIMYLYCIYVIVLVYNVPIS